MFLRKDKRIAESRQRKEKTPFDYTRSWDTMFGPCQSLSIFDIRKLFSASGLDFELIIPLAIRQKIVKDSQSGKKIEIKVLKEMVNEFLQKGGRRKHFVGKKLK